MDWDLVNADLSPESAAAPPAHPLIGGEIHQRVLRELAEIERTEDVRVLYACESGSRAWGFASTDSDFDVRFLYVHRRDWYLSIDERRDVIERPISEDLDISGWDLRKALGLLRKSNPPLLEWLKSPIVYRRDPVFMAEFSALAADWFSPSRCFAHYLHMAAGNWRKYLEGRPEVKLKKYLYVFRPLLACRWIERRSGQVPMLFQELVDGVLEEDGVREALQALVSRKMAGVELDMEPHVPALSDFLSSEIVRLETLSEPEPTSRGTEELNKFFQRYTID
ncbi:MAG: nucleotidyltransferase domain-containing protein [Verrucomicrobiota bacterium]